LAEEVGGGGEDRAVDGVGDFGEGGVEGTGEPGIDSHRHGGFGGPVEADDHLDASAGEALEHGAADLRLEFGEFARCLDGDIGLLAIDGRQFDVGDEVVGGGRAAAEAGHGMHGGMEE
jgi:hypothetical protein